MSKNAVSIFIPSTQDSFLKSRLKKHWYILFWGMHTSASFMSCWR